MTTVRPTDKNVALAGRLSSVGRLVARERTTGQCFFALTSLSSLLIDIVNSGQKCNIMILFEKSSRYFIAVISFTNASY